MTIKVSPGPVPADGSRIQVQQTMDRFVGGTRVFDFSEENFVDADLKFLTSQTEAPASPSRGTMWFKRGEGRLRQWMPHPTDSGASGAWVKLSCERELLAKIRHPVSPGELLWMDTSPSEPHLGVNEQDSLVFMNLAGALAVFDTETDLSFYAVGNQTSASVHWDDLRTRPAPPFFIALDTATTAQFAVVHELGYASIKYTGASDSPFMYYEEGAAVPYLTTAETNFATLARANVALNVDSAPGAVTLVCFKMQRPSNLWR